MFGRVKPLKWSSAKLAYFDYWKGRLYTCAKNMEFPAFLTYEHLAVIHREVEIIRRDCPPD